MLSVKRRSGELITITDSRTGEEIATIHVVEVLRGTVKLGIHAANVYNIQRRGPPDEEAACVAK